MPEDDQHQSGGNQQDDQAAAGQQQQSSQGDGQGQEGQQGQQTREGYIPRERFDEINQQLAEEKARRTYLEEQYYSNQQQASPQQQSQPDSTGGIPKDYSSWEEWHAADPGAATDYRARQAYHQERQATEATEGRQRFLNKVYGKYQHLQDPVKRNTDPVYRQFAAYLKSNPAAGMSEAGLDQLWELAELKAGNPGNSQGDPNFQRQAGAREEYQRQAAAGAMYSPAGTGTQRQGSQQQQIQLDPKADRIRQKYGMTPDEYVKGVKAGHDDPDARIQMKYEKAQRPKP